MDYDRFINTYLGQPIDWDGVYGAQCVDEVAQYCSDNNMPVAYANAKDWWQNPALTGAFDFVQNDTNQPDQLPARGNIVIFSGNQPGSGGYGHINIYDMRTGPNTWQGLDQNWGGQYVHFIPNHVWDYVIGWMVPKAAVPPPTPTPTPVPAPDNHPDPAPLTPAPSPPPAPLPPTVTASTGPDSTVTITPAPPAPVIQTPVNTNTPDSTDSASTLPSTSTTTHLSTPLSWWARLLAWLKTVITIRKA